MDVIAFLTQKPVLIFLHLGFAILAIDAFLWLLGEIVADTGYGRRRIFSASLGVLGYAVTWIIGGYYYVKFYGPLVKPVIKAGLTPWAHAIAMEAKEHIFLFLIPIAVTVYLLARLNREELSSSGLRKVFFWLTLSAAGLGLIIGFLGFIISAAARWGVISL